jgi:hypothetical protein
MSMMLAAAAGLGSNRRRDVSPLSSMSSGYSTSSTSSSTSSTASPLSRHSPGARRKQATANTKAPQRSVLGAERATMAILALLMEKDKKAKEGKKMGTSRQEENDAGKERKTGFLQRRMKIW